MGKEANATLGLSTLGITNFDYEDTFYMFKLYHLEVILNWPLAVPFAGFFNGFVDSVSSQWISR